MLVNRRHWWMLGALLAPAILAAQSLSPLEYRTDSGRRIKITAYGNLASFESPAGFEHIGGSRPREGYMVVYFDPITQRTRLVYDVLDKPSTSLVAGLRDFVPYMMSGPPSGTVPLGQEITATVVVDTRDHVLRLTHLFRLRAGLGGVLIETTITNRLPGQTVGIIAFKSQADINAGGTTANNFTRAGNLILVDNRCAPTGWCPPPPENLVGLGGYPNPIFTINRAFDDAELVSSAPASSANLTGNRIRENNQVTLVWTGNTPLVPGASIKFSRTYSQQ